MRSCLIQLLVTFAVLFLVVWFGVPIGASWLATNALNASGFNGTDTKVDVHSDLPPRILLGHADSIHLTSSQVSSKNLHAATIDLTLNGVELFDRKFDSALGILTGVVVFAQDGKPVTIDKVTIDGVSTGATATLSMSNTEAASLAQSQLQSRGIVATVTVHSPDLVMITSGGQTGTAHLQVNGGELQLVPVTNNLPVITLIAKGDGNPFTLTSVGIGPTAVTLVGTIDLQTLLGI